MMRIIILVDGLSFEAGDGIELFDLRGPESGEGAEHRALDFRDLGVLHRVNKGVLRPRRMLLELLRRVLLTEWGDLGARGRSRYDRPDERLRLRLGGL
jgi:hypothetical protein